MGFPKLNATALLVALAVALGMPVLNRVGAATPNSGVAQAFVPFGGELSEVRGIKMTAAPAVPDFGSGALMEPQDITLRYPDGVIKELPVKSSFIVANENKIIHVGLDPLMHPAPLKEVKANILATLAKLDIQPDRWMKRDMADWPDDLPPVGQGAIPGNFGTRILTPTHGLIGGISVTSNPQGWFYLLSVDAIAPIHIASIWPATDGSATTLPWSGSLSLEIPEDAGKLSGLNAHVLSSSFSQVDCPGPRSFKLHVHDGTTLSLMAPTAHLYCFKGKVEAAILEMLAKSVSYREAKENLLQALEGMSLKTNTELKSDMAGWPDDAPYNGDSRVPYYEAGVNDLHGVMFNARLFPDAAGGWRYYLTFVNLYWDSPISTQPSSASVAPSN